MSTASYESLGSFYLGKQYDLVKGEMQPDRILYDSKDLTTHAVCVGMTGSGKTGLCLSLIEEAAIDGIPVIAIDPKGDLGNLMLTFPGLEASEFRPWIDEDEAVRKGLTPDEFAKQTAKLWKNGLAEWDQDGSRVAKFKDAVDIGIYTPGSNAGLPLSIIRSFQAPNATILNDSDSFRERVSSAVGGLLTLLGVNADPIRSREYILVSNIVTHYWQQGQNLSLAALIQAIQQPPFSKIGFMSLETIFPQADRFALSMQLNNLLASPGFESWMTGEPLDIERLLSTPAGKPRISILSIAHLSEKERMFFVTILLNEVLTWTRSQPGTSSLRAILYMDEVFGYFPPTANPPSKQPMLTLLKQARAYGVGVVLATQNPVDLDYKGLSNTGTWFIGRLQTERDKLRVLDGLEGASTTAGSAFERDKIDATLSAVGKRVFLMHNVHDSEPTVFHTRWALSYLRGPMTRQQITTLMDDKKQSTQTQTEIPIPPPASPVMPASTTAPAATPAEIPLAGEASQPAYSMRPMIPASIPQRFLSLEQPLPSASRLIYRPAILGVGKLHYTDAKSKVDSWRDFTLMADASSSVSTGLWSMADSMPQHPDYDLDADQTGIFADLPAECLESKNFTKWKTELKSFLYQDFMLPLWYSASPKLYSKPDETESGFRMRIKQALREDRDLEIEKMKSKFASKLSTMKDRIRRAEERVDREKSQMNQQGIYTAISFGSSILGAMFGRKIASATNVSKAATTMRSASRVAREKGDVSRAQENLEEQREKLATMEEEFEAQIDTLEAPVKTEELPIEEYLVRPRKSDITIQTVSLAWLPFAVDQHGIATPLYSSRE